MTRSKTLPIIDGNTALLSRDRASAGAGRRWTESVVVPSEAALFCSRFGGRFRH
jgi:hypothetical protein